MKTLLATSIALVLSQNILAQTLQNGLIAHYEFEANAKDSSNNGNDGIEHNNITYKDGVFGYAAEFDGISSYIEVPHKDNQNLKTMTFSAWVYDYSHRNHISETIISKAVSHSGVKPPYPVQNRQYYMTSHHHQLNTGEVTIFSSSTPLHWEVFKFNPTPIPIKEWKHLVFTYDGKDMKLYINGILDKTQSISFIPFIPTKPDSLLIGAMFYDAEKRIEYVRNGLIDDLRIYNRALNECEVKKLYDPVAYPDNKLNDKICENKPPIADFTVTRTDPNLRILQLDASSSKDEDGNIVKYEWLIQPDGLSATGKKPKITLPEGGVYEIVLKVTDNKGAQNIKKLTYTLDDADCQGRAKYEVSNQTLKAPYVQVLDNTNKIVWIGEALFEQVPQSETLFNLSNIKELNPPPAIGIKVCPATYKLSTKTMKLPFIDIFQNGFPNMTYSGVLKDLDKKDGKDLFVLQNLIRKQ